MTFYQIFGLVFMIGAIYTIANWSTLFPTRPVNIKIHFLEEGELFVDGQTKGVFSVNQIEEVSVPIQEGLSIQLVTGEKRNSISKVDIWLGLSCIHHSQGENSKEGFRVIGSYVCYDEWSEEFELH